MFALGSKKSFGIDIGTQTIKIVELSSRNNKFYIDNYSIWNDDIDGVIQQKSSDAGLSAQQITSIIKAMLKESGMKISEAYIALPSYLALFALIQVPMLEEKELITAVPLEAKKHIPVPLSSVQLDWINLGKNKLQEQYNILIVAIPNTIATKYIEVVKSLGIKSKGFELDCFSTLRSISLPKEEVCVIDIGARNSTVMVVDPDKKLQTIQAFDFGGNHISESISKLRNISIQEAENLKVKNGLFGPDKDISDFMQSKISAFIEGDVIRLLNNVRDTMGIEIKNIALLGGGAKMSGVKEYVDLIFKQQFSSQNINVFISSPIQNLGVKDVKDTQRVLDIWQDLILSIGIALKNYIE